LRRRCIPPDVPMSITPFRAPNCLRTVSSDAARNAATSATVRYSVGRGAGVRVVEVMGANTQRSASTPIIRNIYFCPVGVEGSAGCATKVEVSVWISSARGDETGISSPHFLAVGLLRDQEQKENSRIILLWENTLYRNSHRDIRHPVISDHPRQSVHPHDRRRDVGVICLRPCLLLVCAENSNQLVL
jgi:hypothetical protein